MTLPAPALIHAFDVEATVDPPVEVGTGVLGQRRLIAVPSGTVSGPRLSGRVLPGGADFQLIRPDGVADIHARYVIETAGGARVYVENSGLRHGPPEAMARLIRGEPVDPALIYFRTAPRFETAAPELAWLTRALFLGIGARFPDSVRISFYEVA